MSTRRAGAFRQSVPAGWYLFSFEDGNTLGHVTLLVCWSPGDPGGCFPVSVFRLENTDGLGFFPHFGVAHRKRGREIQKKIIKVIKRFSFTLT